jgi:magnesium chelatase accessory protein
MTNSLVWERDGGSWPHHERSRFVMAAGLRWHVQQWPAPPPPPSAQASSHPSAHPSTHTPAPALLLLHGTGASTHSWAGLAPLLAQRYAVLSCDLPGHAFSGKAPGDGASLPGMAAGVRALLAATSFAPQWCVGHSAGAAIAVRMALDGLPLHGIVGINAALMPLPGLAGSLFSPAAKLLALNPLVPHLFSWGAHGPSVLQRLLDSTGSRIDAAGTALYRQLVTHPGHVAGALAMMARWDLPTLAQALPQLRVPLHLLVGAQDATVPPADAQRVQALLPGCTVTSLPGLGHLAHEEDPAHVAEIVGRCVGAPVQ